MTRASGKLLLQPAAKSDLSEIRRYFARRNPVRAKSFVEEIREHCGRLAKRPRLHVIVEQIAPDIRKAAHGAYLIFYTEIDGGILVLRVLHGARELGNIEFR
jgi:toxin ParE1/3/4